MEKGSQGRSKRSRAAPLPDGFRPIRPQSRRTRSSPARPTRSPWRLPTRGARLTLTSELLCRIRT
eukprot:7173424-Prymnesium_polylepis.1